MLNHRYYSSLRILSSRYLYHRICGQVSRGLLSRYSQTLLNYRVQSLHINRQSLEQFSKHINTNRFCYLGNKLSWETRKKVYNKKGVLCEIRVLYRFVEIEAFSCSFQLFKNLCVNRCNNIAWSSFYNFDTDTCPQRLCI